MNPPPKNKKKQINIELTEEVADGIYSNLAIITHSTSEFVIDFVKIMPRMPKAKVKARILLTPQNAKKLLHALNDNIMKFEAMHGGIAEPTTTDLPPIKFGGPPSQA